jgi:cytoskeletal protein CcmA (bactofilin family)
MALFSTSTTPNGNGAHKERRRIEPSTLSIVAADLVINGDLESAGVIKIEGRVTGSVRAGQQILIGAEAVVEGDLLTREAVVGGTVHGTIHAADRVEVQAQALVEGDIHTRNLVIQEGGRVNGMVTMRADGVPDNPAAIGA